MKIVFVSGLYPPATKGGGEISTHLIAQGLVRRGHEVRVITQGDVREEVEFEGVPVLRLPVALTAKPAIEKWHFRKVARALDREVAKIIGEDGTGDWIVHAHDYKSALALSEMSVENKAVTIRDYAQISGDTNNILSDGSIPDKEQTWFDAWRSQRVKEVSGMQKLMRWLQYMLNLKYRRQALAGIYNQVFISQAECDGIAGQQPLTDKNIAVIYNPVSANYLNSPYVEGTGGNVLYVGRVEMYKGVGLLLAAWREVAEKFPQAKLRIVGEGAQRADYEKLVELWGLQYRVSFVGKIAWDRLRKVYDEARIVVAPHLWIEPFGRTVAEAMARGKVVVASNIGGAAEMIGQERGILFERGSVKDLTTKLTQALALDDFQGKNIRQAARKWTVVSLNQDVIASQYEEFYELVSSK